MKCIFAKMKAKKLSQAASAVLMIRPKHFGFNPETSGSNVFQKKNKISNATIRKKTLEEFNHFITLLKKYAIDVIVINDTAKAICPDAAFPNNWFSTHHNGKVILYPMAANNRRLERRTDIFKLLQTKHKFKVSASVNLTLYENAGLYLEGTGSIVFDHLNKIAYANKSSRTSPLLVKLLCMILNYSHEMFAAHSKKGKEIYHTNVMMTVAKGFAVVCAESITSKKERNRVVKKLTSTGHEIIDITFKQMEKFAGNMLQVKNKKGELITIMSKSAFDCLDNGHLEIILKYGKILAVSIPVIESVGGGSVRCMMAEIFLPRDKN